jgi:hypothetical protein
MTTKSKPQAVPDALDPNGLTLTTPTADAQAVIRDLEKQRETLSKRRAEHEVERQRIAYSARAQSDKEASARLGEMTSEAIRHEHEMRDLDAALTTAREHLREAQAAEARRADRQRAREILAVTERMKAAGQTLADALEVLVAAGDDLHKATDALHQLGCQSPTGQQILSLGERAIRSAIQETIWARCIERVGPMERMNFANITEQWAAAIERQIGESARDTEAA